MITVSKTCSPPLNPTAQTGDNTLLIHRNQHSVSKKYPSQTQPYMLFVIPGVRTPINAFWAVHSDALAALCSLEDAYMEQVGGSMDEMRGTEAGGCIAGGGSRLACR